MSGRILHEHHLVHTAARWGESSRFEGVDTAYAAFSRVMEYRKDIAVKMLSAEDQRVYDLLREQLEYCNKQIRIILAIDPMPEPTFNNKETEIQKSSLP